MKALIKQQIILPGMIFLLVVGMAVSPVLEANATGEVLAADSQGISSPGNYCISCHRAQDPRLQDVTAWKGGIGREVNNPCPASSEIHNQLYYTERMLLIIGRAEESTGALPEKTQRQLDGYTQSYSRQLDQPVTSLAAFTIQAQTTRYRLNKIYSALSQVTEGVKKQTVFLYAGIISLILLGSLIWGLLNTRGYTGMSTNRSLRIPATVISILLVAVLFSLPIFRVPEAEVVNPTLEEQQAQAVLDTADRAAMAADRSQARAWMLAKLGKEWNAHGDMRAQRLLEEATAAIQQASGNDDALWGQSLAVQEAGNPQPIELEKGALIAVDLNAARMRMWSLPLVAVEWNGVDAKQAQALLQAEQNSLAAQSGVYRDLQMRGVSLAWAEIDPVQAYATATAIHDPAIRAWTQREIAIITGQRNLFSAAADSARMVIDPVQRARALREVGAASGDASLFDEALSVLNGVEGAAQAYALSDLAAASGNGDLVEAVGPDYPDALTYALLRLGEYQAAWDASTRIQDPIEQARAMAAIAGEWENPEAAMQISLPLYRDLALRDIIRKTGNASLTNSMESPYYKVQALTALGNYEAAVLAGEGMGDAFPLVELSLKLMEKYPEAALALMDSMSREIDKAVVLRAAAAVTGEQELFEQALGMALAARVQGDPLAPSQASLELGQALWDTNPINARLALRQASEAAQKISIK